MKEEIPKMTDVLRHIKNLESKIEELEEEHSELIVDNHNLKKQLTKRDELTFLKLKPKRTSHLFEERDKALKNMNEKFKKEWVEDAK